jgi:hypothetical protein
VVSGLGVLASVVAWALPFWMTILGVGLAMVAYAAAPTARRAVALMAAGQLVGMATLFVGVIAEVGPTDSYGDYPAADGIALMVTAGLTIAGLVDLTRSTAPEPALATAAV